MRRATLSTALVSVEGATVLDPAPWANRLLAFLIDWARRGTVRVPVDVPKPYFQQY